MGKAGKRREEDSGGWGQGQWRSRVGVREHAKGWCRGDVSRAKRGERVKKGQVGEERRQQSSSDIFITFLCQRNLNSPFDFIKLIF